MADGLTGLWHDGIVSGHHNHSDIGDFSTTGTHRRKGFVTRRIQKCYLFAILQSHFIGPDMLGDSTCFTGYDIGISDIIE